MSESFELDPVDWITAGATGEPGQRTFYLQARQGAQVVALLVEKSQVAGLAQLAQQLLARVGVTVTPDDLDVEAQQLVEPVIPAWRAGTMSLGVDTAGERFVLEAEEVRLDEDDEDDDAGGDPDLAQARFWMSRDQLVAMAAYAAFIVEAGARERCPLCRRPIDPGRPHVCPASNGHGPLA